MRSIVYCFAAIAIALLVDLTAAHAHGLSVNAHVDDGMICAEGRFPNGRRIGGKTIQVFDDQARLIEDGTTDQQGRYCFAAPHSSGVRIVLTAGPGHTAEARLSAAQIHGATADPIAELDPMTISARPLDERLSGELEAYGHPVQIIPGEVISKSGYTDLNQALQVLVPGLSVAMRGGRGDYAIARLRGGAQILWLLDGVRLNNRLYGTGYLDTISVRMIERIEILKGGEGLFYGTDAAFGVINVITKPVADADAPSGQFGLAYGSHDHQEIFGDVSDAFAGHGVLLFGNHQTWDGYRLFSDAAHDLVDNHNPNGQAQPPAWLRNKAHGFERRNLGAKYRKQFDVLGTATLKLHVQRNEGTFDFSELATTSAVNERTEDIGFLKWDHDVNDRFSYYVKTYLHRWWTEHTRWQPDGRNALPGVGQAHQYVNDQARWGYEDWGVNLMGSWRLGQGHEILVGGDYQNYWAKDEVWHIEDQREQVQALFAEYRPYLFFSPATQLAVGGRYNRTGAYTKSIWHTSLKTPLNPNAYVRALAGTSFRLPTAEQLYLREDNAYGNPDLAPEGALNMDLGFGGAWSVLTWDIGYFYRRLTDAITLVTYQSPSQTWTTFANNTGKTVIDGIEMQLTATPIATVMLSCGATWVNIDVENTSNAVRQVPAASTARTAFHHQTTHGDADPGAGGNNAATPATETGDTPEFMLKAVLSYRSAAGGFGSDFAVRYLGDTESRYDDRIDYGDYVIADLSGFVHFGRAHRHRFSLRLDNLFDQDYAPDVGRAQAAGTGEPFYYLYRGMPFSLVLSYAHVF